MNVAASDSDLMEFLRRAKAQGVSDEFVVSLLRQNGLSDRRIFRVYSAYYEGELGLPVPTKVRGTTIARDAFLYVLNFLTLGCWIVALGQIFYILIEHAFPDPATSGYTGVLRDQIAWQVAAVIVAFPFFMFIHKLIARELKRRPDLYDSPERQRITYLALIIAAVVVITDAVWFIATLIRGELTVKFILDSLVLLVLGGGVFAYYLRTMEAPASEA